MSERRPAEVFPPGDFIKEELEARELTQGDLAEILGAPSGLSVKLLPASERFPLKPPQGLGKRSARVLSSG
jgi:HTH-type transcriptional regulator/antitoxin HigA